METIIWGVDPGNSGGICRMSDSEIFVYSIPTRSQQRNSKSKKKTVYDLPGIYKILKPYQNQQNIVVIEEVSVRSGEGGVSGFSFGTGFGVLQGIFCGVFGGVSPNLVRPQSWKKYYTEYVDDSDIVSIKQDVTDKTKNIKDISNNFNKKINNLNKQKKTANKSDKEVLSNMIKEIQSEMSDIVLVEKKDIERLNRKKKYRSKEISREIASKLYPDLSEKFKLVKSDGLAEALLIAHYWKNQNG